MKHPRNLRKLSIPGLGLVGLMVFLAGCSTSGQGSGELTTARPGVVVDIPFTVWDGGKR